jgi:FKBP-type peptidyl-prolyl cis-trans isomerase
VTTDSLGPGAAHAAPGRTAALLAWLVCAWLAHGTAAAQTQAPADVAAPPLDAQTTPSGLAMRVLRAGQGSDRPLDNDCAKVHFIGWKRDGSVLSNSRVQFGGEPALQCLRTAIPGVAEALKLMAPAEQRRVWIPARLGFTSDEPDERPMPSMDLTFDLELVEIIKAPPTPDGLTAPPKTAVRTRSGLALQVLKKGRGTAHPSLASTVTLHVSGWKADGTLVESTAMAGQPAVYVVEHVIPGWREGLQRMVVGDKVRLWIPAALAYGQKATGRRKVPTGDLVYDIELLALE